MDFLIAMCTRFEKYPDLAICTVDDPELSNTGSSVHYRLELHIVRR